MIGPAVPPLKRQDFDYNLPENLIAQQPLEDRQSARLIVRQRDQSIDHRMITDLPELLPSGSLLIVNETEVFASRLHGHLPSGGKVELFLIKNLKAGMTTNSRWLALGRPLKKIASRNEATVSLQPFCYG